MANPVAPPLQTPHLEDQRRVSRGEEEPTNVSQYFLSDIFTEVDE